MINFESIICVLLFSCFTEKIEIDICPESCQCYSAPEGGAGDDTAYSLLCDANKISSLRVDQNIQQFSKFKDKSINTFVFINVLDFNYLPKNLMTGLSVNNLVFKDSNNVNVKQNSIKILGGLLSNNLQVLTFINMNFDKTIEFDWSEFENCNQLKAIHIELGTLKIINNNFAKIPGQKIISVTISSTQLNTIDKNAFKNYHALKLLTIIKNSITDLEWMEATDYPDLWYLDLRQNQLKTFPKQLAENLKSLRVLKLGDNKMRTISADIMNTLFAKLKEFSFFPIPDSNTQQKDLFYATKEMSWIYEIFHGNKKCPRFLADSIEQIECVRFHLQQTKLCKDLAPAQFNYDYKEYLSTIELEGSQYYLTYGTGRVFLSGAVVPFGSFDKKTELLDTIVESGGNVITIFIDKRTWTQLSSSNINDVEQAMTDLETFLQKAQDHKKFVIIGLWKANEIPNQYLTDKSERNRYLTSTLYNLVNRLNQFQSLAAWNVMDEPDTIIINHILNADQCLDTFEFEKSTNIPNDFKIETVLNLIGEQAQLIHSVRPMRKLVTVGMSDKNALHQFRSQKPGFNHFEDDCIYRTTECKHKDCYLDFYTINVQDTIRFVDINSKMVSEAYPKPVVATVNQDNTADLIDKYINANKHYEGILATFNVYPGNNNNLKAAMQSLRNKDTVIATEKSMIL